METKQLEQQMLEINQKLDLLTQYMQEQQRRQREWQELKEDMTLIGKDIFQTAVEELDEVAHHFDTTDLMYLLKKLLRNTRNFSKMMDQFESAFDFVNDATPLGKQVLNQIMDTLSELENKGYFEFGKEAFKIIDTIVTTFTVDDIRLLRENISAIIITFRNMTQPEMLGSMNNALHFFQKMDVQVDKKIGYWQLMKEMRDPEFKRGIAFMINFMKNMVQTNGKSEDIHDEIIK
ncbi:MAG: DUF1641 domain-containing protein [Calditrichia bacterium]|nr:DUF1641 domain-containing protein [Calditrichia bacterium]